MNGQRETEERRKDLLPLTILLAFLLCVAILVIVFLLVGKGDSGEESEPTVSVEKLTESIDVPGYDTLHLKAGETKQEFGIENPPQNFCYFKISLVMEDGTVLWTSEPVEPGKTSGQIVLNRALEKGTYRGAMLRFACFSDAACEDALNSAQTILTLVVE